MVLFESFEILKDWKRLPPMFLLSIVGAGFNWPRGGTLLLLLTMIEKFRYQSSWDAGLSGGMW
jgi:hypothetical protein